MTIEKRIQKIKFQIEELKWYLVEFANGTKFKTIEIKLGDDFVIQNHCGIVQETSDFLERLIHKKIKKLQKKIKKIEKFQEKRKRLEITIDN